MKTLFFNLGKYFIKKSGARFVAVAVNDEVLASAKMLCGQVMAQDTSGEHKRAQVLRALMNRHPDEKQSALAMAIEIVCSG